MIHIYSNYKNKNNLLQIIPEDNSSSTGFKLVKNEKFGKLQLFAISILISMLLGFFPNKVISQNTFSIDFSDTSTYHITCGFVNNAQWSVKNQSCMLYTPYFRMETQGCQYIKYDFKVNQSGAGTINDKIYIQYQVNDGPFITDTVISGNEYNAVHDLPDSIYICYNDYLRIRIIMTTTSQSDFWAIKNGNGTVTGSFETYTTKPTPLPVELSYFKVDCKNYGSLISWGTNSETNNQYFTIEKSYNMESWTIISEVPGATNSNSQLDYSVPDYLNNNDRIYYRLKQTDINGSYKYYSPKPRICNVINSFDIVNSYGSELKAHITYVVDDTKPVVFELYNIEGKLIVNESDVPQIGENLKTLNTFDLEKGIYFIVVIQDNNRVSSKFMVN